MRGFPPCDIGGEPLVPFLSGGGMYGERGEVMTVWLTGETIIAKEGERVCTGRMGAEGGDNGAMGGAGGIGLRFGGGPDEEDELTRDRSSGMDNSSACFRFFEDEICGPD